jgi:hypothetical protein
MFFEEYDPYNAFILILALFSGIDTLQKLPSLATIFPDKPSSISNKKLPTFISKLAGSDIGIIAILIQLGKYFFQASSNMIIHSNIIGCEYKDVITK